MEQTTKEHITFYLNGKHPAAELDATADLEPALLAHYRNLDELRYDYPLVLLDDDSDQTFTLSLSSVVDQMMETMAVEDGEGVETDRLRHLALRLERQIRKQATAGDCGSLTTLWEQAQQALQTSEDAPCQNDLARLRGRLQVEGQVVDCNRDLPRRLLEHGWLNTQRHKVKNMRVQLDRLIKKLGDILKADEVNSESGLSADNLEASFGNTFTTSFDFEALSSLLTTAKPSSSLPRQRRKRIEQLLEILKSEHFFVADDTASNEGGEAHTFVFQNCSKALEAYRERLPKMVSLAKAMLMAELEVDGTYQEAIHDVVFDALGASDLDLDILEQFPDYLTFLQDPLTSSESAALIQALSAGLPLKVLLQTDDISVPATPDNGQPMSGISVSQLSNMAIGIGGVFVLQAASSHLYHFRERLLKGFSYSGPALFSVYSGDGPATGARPPYLVAAAAMESRAFPAFAYDPAAGMDWASRFYVGDNPQPELDWPIHKLSYEDEALQGHTLEVGFTLADFYALDDRFANQLARVPQAQWTEAMVPFCEFLEEDPQGLPDRVPFLYQVDADHQVHRVFVTHQLVRDAQRCQERWHTLRELGGIRNSFAEQLLAEERQAWEAQQAQLEADAPKASAPPTAAGTSDEAEIAPAPEASEARDPDEACIETIRCSTCNECTEINDRMFKYNENKQAYIADLSAGTYAEMVLAAERCQLAIIHPGKPLNPDEPNLDELLQRAKPFL